VVGCFDCNPSAPIKEAKSADFRCADVDWKEQYTGHETRVVTRGQVYMAQLCCMVQNRYALRTCALGVYPGLRIVRGKTSYILLASAEGVLLVASSNHYSKNQPFQLLVA
jgi:hypothetical protein